MEVSPPAANPPRAWLTLRLAFLASRRQVLLALASTALLVALRFVQLALPDAPQHRANGMLDTATNATSLATNAFSTVLAVDAGGERAIVIVTTVLTALQSRGGMSVAIAAVMVLLTLYYPLPGVVAVDVHQDQLARDEDTGGEHAGVGNSEQELSLKRSLTMWLQRSFGWRMSNDVASSGERSGGSNSGSNRDKNHSAATSHYLRGSAPHALSQRNRTAKNHTTRSSAPTSQHHDAPVRPH
jgi:hypothetical protein